MAAKARAAQSTVGEALPDSTRLTYARLPPMRRASRA